MPYKELKTLAASFS